MTNWILGWMFAQSVWDVWTAFVIIVLIRRSGRK